MSKGIKSINLFNNLNFIYNYNNLLILSNSLFYIDDFYF